MEHFLSNLPSYDEVIIAGDFNIDLFNLDSNPRSVDFITLMSANSLIPMITKPTRITEETCSLIDNIFISKPCMTMSGNIVCTLSDHYPNFLIHRNLFRARAMDDIINYSYRPINDKTLDNLYISLSIHDFSSIVYCRDVDLALTDLQDTIMYYFNIHCPINIK